jgi:tetratricopeptide (TPR) repeat protein
MSEETKQDSELGLDVDQALAQFRAYLETEVDWTPVVPPADELSRDERWERICGVLLAQAESAGQDALQALSTVRARDRDGALRARLDRFERYLEDGDFGTALTLFTGEPAKRLIRMGNEAFAEGRLAGAKQIFAFAHLANPLMVEPLIGRLTIEWEERGPERAADLYAAVVDLFRNPMLDLFAADCYRAAGRAEAADALLGRALAQLEDDEQARAVYGDLEAELRAAMRPGGAP